MGKFKNFQPSRLQTSLTDSYGCQLKWKKSNLWYKADLEGYESLSESIISLLESCITNFNYVNYWMSKEVHDGVVCNCSVSYDFSKGGSIVTLFELLRSLDFNNLDVFEKSNPKERLNLIMTLQPLMPKVNLAEYLAKCILLDSLTLNIDRHLNNLAVIYNNQCLEECPVFDNGLGLLSDVGKFPMSKPLQTNLYKAKNKAKPFKSDFKKQVYLIKDLIDYTLEIDVNKFYKLLDNFDPGDRNDRFERCKQVLDIRLNELEGLVWKEL